MDDGIALLRCAWWRVCVLWRARRDDDRWSRLMQFLEAEAPERRARPRMTGGLDGDRDVLLRNRHALDELAVNIVDLREARSRLRKTMEQIQRRRGFEVVAALWLASCDLLGR